jgi:site-specific recombinase XerD
MAVRRRYAVLSSFFNFLKDMGSVEANPARQLPLPKLKRPVPVFLSEEMSRKLVAAADRPWTEALIVLLLTTGVRKSEAAAITLDDLDLDGRLLLVRGKGDKERVVPLADEAVAALRGYLAHRVPSESRRLFVSARGGHPVHNRTIARMVQTVIGKAGLTGKGISTHKFRHTFATQLIRRGVDVRTVQELLGHSSLQTTAKYLHSDMRTKALAVGKLADILK